MRKIFFFLLGVTILSALAYAADDDENSNEVQTQEDENIRAAKEAFQGVFHWAKVYGRLPKYPCLKPPNLLKFHSYLF